jgi:hypothetical protein
MTALTALHPKLAFVDAGGLYVAYRASAEAQRLEIRVEAAGPDARGMGTSLLRALLAIVNAGACGGAEFLPSVGRAALVSGPRVPDDPGGRGPIFEWEVEVAGVSPLYLRSMVEDFALAAWSDHPVVALGLRGSLPLDASPLSARTADVRRWLLDADAYPGDPPTPPFPLKETRDPDATSAMVRLRPDGARATDVLEPFELLMVRWSSYLAGLPSREAQPIGSSGFFRSAASRRELVARVEEIDVRPAPARAALVALLTRFHEDVAPLAHAEIRLP